MGVKYRIKFTKQGNMRFIGHLDLLRTFQRAIRRAGLPAAYSQGFNPHQLISFALPLSLGMASVAEIADIELREAADAKDFSEELAARLGAAMPKGVEVLKCRPLASGEKAAAELCAAEYAIRFPDAEAVTTCLNQALAAETIVARHKDKEVDIRPGILSLSPESDGSVRALLAAGSARNVKPELLAGHLCGLAGTPFDPLRVGYCRMEMYKTDNGRLVPLC